MLRSLDRVFAVGPMMLAAAGCSDPVPSSAAAGLNLNVGVAASCPMMSGFPDDLGNPPPTMTSSGAPVFNGEAGVSVSCTLRDTGGGSYAVSASITSRDPRVAFGLNDGTINIADGKGTGAVSINSTSLESTIDSKDTPCTLSVIAIQADKQALWAHFDCSRLSGNPSPICQAHGEFVLQNCSK